MFFCAGRISLPSVSFVCLFWPPPQGKEIHMPFPDTLPFWRALVVSSCDINWTPLTVCGWVPSAVWWGQELERQRGAEWWQSTLSLAHSRHLINAQGSKTPSLASTMGRVCSHRRQTWARGPRLKQPGGPRPEGPEAEHLLVFAFLRENQASTGVSRPRPLPRLPPPRPPGPPSVGLPTLAPRCPASTGKAALGAGILEPPSCSWPTTWALPGGPCLSRKERGNKKQTLVRGVCEMLILQAREGGGCPRLHVSLCMRVSVHARVRMCVMWRLCTHVHTWCTCVCAGARVHACVFVSVPPVQMASQSSWSQFRDKKEREGERQG